MIDKDIIERYLNGHATKEDLKALEEYFQTDDLQTLKGKMQEDWNSPLPAEPLPPELVDEMRSRIHQTIDSKKRDSAPTQGRFWWPAVAAAVIALVLGLASYLWINQPSQTILYTTGYGDWKSFELPDGSTVSLNANSSIEFAPTWAAGADRWVELTGEAFFEVEKKPATQAKFLVVTKDLTVEVLGTAFNVNSRAQQTDVFLESGSLKLRLPEGHEEVLVPGDFLAYSGKQKSIVKRQSEVPAEQHASWKDGAIIMKDKTGQYIFSKLEEIYGIKVSVQDTALLGKVKTISVPIDKLEVAIQIIEGGFNTKVTQQGEVLYLE